MNSENATARAISTSAIWLSVACILTFGTSRMNLNGEEVVFLVGFLLPAGIVAGAAFATAVIWGYKFEKRETPKESIDTPPTRPEPPVIKQ